MEAPPAESYHQPRRKKSPNRHYRRPSRPLSVRKSRKSSDRYSKSSGYDDNFNTDESYTDQSEKIRYRGGYASSLDDVVYHELVLDDYPDDDNDSSSGGYSSSAHYSPRSNNYSSLSRSPRPSSERYSHCKLVTFLLTGDPKNKKVARLIRYFKGNDFFDLHVVDIAPPYSLPINSTLTRAQSIEIFRYQYILRKAAREYRERNVLILKDTSVINTPINDLEAVIRTGCRIGDWDFFYLTRWLDLCDLYDDETKVRGTMNVIVETFSPNGNQAIIFSPHGRDVVIGKKRMRNGEYFTPINIPLSSKLNEEITLRNTKAITVVPNVIDFDVTQAETVSDLAKVCDCRRPEVIEEEDTSGTTLSLFWFVVIILIVLALAWALYMVGPSKHQLERDRPRIEVNY